MTYVSRRTRIGVSRWPDECNPAYRLWMSKYRCDGRLKRYSSSDDLRAWINDNCVKHEYLLDLMSDGEFSDSKPFRLFGRFVPVPILLQLIQNPKDTKEEGTQDVTPRRSKSATNERVSNSSEFCVKSEGEGASLQEKDSGLNTAEWEKQQLQKNLIECTRLLNKAVEKLEKIDSIVSSSQEPEVQDDFSKGKLSCSCSAVSSSNNSEAMSCTRSSKNFKDSTKFNELMRKISHLRAKLKKVQECRQEVNAMIRSSRQRVECASSPQLTEIFSRQEEAELKKLEKKMEKLIKEKGKLLSEMCDALTTLNNLKKSSMNFRKRSSQPIRNSRDSGYRRNPGSSVCTCTCKYASPKFESSDTGRSNPSESSFMQSTYDFEKRNQQGKRYSCQSQRMSNNENNFSNSKPAIKQKHCHKGSDSRYSTGGHSTADTPRPSGNIDSKTKEKKSKVHFACPKSPCQKKLEADDLSAFQNSLTPQQQSLISGILQNIQQARPSTTPTTRREYREASGGTKCRSSLERRAKSETTMKDIEKTLRNYEYRLSNLDDLDHKVEEVKEKISESQCLKKNLQNMKAEAQMQREADREKSERQINKLCSENWELKRQVERLTLKFNAQTKRIQSLRCGVLKARELEMGLECQAQELKKKLSEYQEGFEHQRKCISKWESVVAEQRTEIENLMNHIRMLTKRKKEDEVRNNERNCLQKSRSYIQNIQNMPQGRRTSNRPKTQSSVLEPPPCNNHYCCYDNYNEFPHSFNGQMCQQQQQQQQQGKCNAGYYLGES